MSLNKRRLLLDVIKGLGVLSAVVLLIAKCPYVRVMEAVCVDNSAYGNASVDAKLRQFKIRLPEPVGSDARFTPPGSTEGYRLFLMGDSFLAYHRGHASLAQLLSENFPEPAKITSGYRSGPVCLFQREVPGARAGGKRIVLLERTEWHLAELAQTEPCPPISNPVGRTRQWAQKFFDMAVSDSEERLRYLLFNSVITAPLIEAWNTELYARFGLLPSSTPIASNSPPYLFSRVETDPDLPSSFYAPHDDALVSAIADNVEKASEKLRSDYGVELIFMPVPSRYTIYHRFARPDRYDDFLPRLYKELSRRRVAYIDLYGPFMSSRESVYFPTDVHWNGRGIAIALEAAVRAVGTLRAAR
jgi:hypothetical protein